MPNKWSKIKDSMSPEAQARVDAKVEETMDTLDKMDSQYTEEEREMSKMIHFPDLYGNNGDEPNA